ncbi:hypothetical protein Ddc_16738 [Ditylenchus destructor]|nr:hypothetical protein Ddc_16738 [Ditylenchus destructor]
MDSFTKTAWRDVMQRFNFNIDQMEAKYKNRATSGMVSSETPFQVFNVDKNKMEFDPEYCGAVDEKTLNRTLRREMNSLKEPEGRAVISAPYLDQQEKDQKCLTRHAKMNQLFKLIRTEPPVNDELSCSKSKQMKQRLKIVATRKQSLRNNSSSCRAAIPSHWIDFQDVIIGAIDDALDVLRRRDEALRPRLRGAVVDAFFNRKKSVNKFAEEYKVTAYMLRRYLQLSHENVVSVLGESKPPKAVKPWLTDVATYKQLKRIMLETKNEPNSQEIVRSRRVPRKKQQEKIPSRGHNIPRSAHYGVDYNLEKCPNNDHSRNNRYVKKWVADSLIQSNAEKPGEDLIFNATLEERRVKSATNKALCDHNVDSDELSRYEGPILRVILNKVPPSNVVKESTLCPKITVNKLNEFVKLVNNVLSCSKSKQMKQRLKIVATRKQSLRNNSSNCRAAIPSHWIDFQDVIIGAVDDALDVLRKRDEALRPKLRGAVVDAFFNRKKSVNKFAEEYKVTVYMLRRYLQLSHENVVSVLGESKPPKAVEPWLTDVATYEQLKRIMLESSASQEEKDVESDCDDDESIYKVKRAKQVSLNHSRQILPVDDDNIFLSLPDRGATNTANNSKLTKRKSDNIVKLEGSRKRKHFSGNTTELKIAIRQVMVPHYKCTGKLSVEKVADVLSFFVAKDHQLNETLKVNGVSMDMLMSAFDVCNKYIDLKSVKLQDSHVDDQLA